MCEDMDDEASQKESKRNDSRINIGPKKEKENVRLERPSTTTKPVVRTSGSTSGSSTATRLDSGDWRSRPEYQNQPPARDYESFKDEHWKGKSEEQVRTRANYYKELGNELVAKEKWNEAIKMYSNAIGMYPLDTVFYANRALCHLKLQQYKEAQKDCDTALVHNDTYVKAYLRRATAHQNQGNYQLAKQDFRTVLKYEPNNRGAKDGLVSLEKSMQSSTSSIRPGSSSKPSSNISKKEVPVSPKLETLSSSAERKPGSSSVESSVIKTWLEEEDDDRVLNVPITRPAHLQSTKNSGLPSRENRENQEKSGNGSLLGKSVNLFKTKPLKSIEVEEVHCDYQSPLKSNGIDTLLRKLAPSTARSKSSHIVQQKVTSLKSQETKETGPNLIPKSVQDPTGQGIKVASERKAVENKPQIIQEIKPDPVEVASVSSVENVNVPHVPISYVGFSKSWMSTKDEPVKQYLYLKKISGSKLANIFGDSLENSVLSDIISILLKEFLPRNERIYPFLHGLSVVRRFRTLILFLTEEDKTALRRLIDYCQSKEECPEPCLSQLRQTFEI